MAGALRAGAHGQRRRFDPRARKRPLEFLSPVSHVSRGTVAIDHLQWRLPYVGPLVAHAGGDVDHLSSTNRLTFIAETHFSRPFEHEINLFLLVVVPGNLT